MKITRFEDIEAWQEARKLVNLVYDAINASQIFARDFRFSIRSTHRPKKYQKWTQALSNT